MRISYQGLACFLHTHSTVQGLSPRLEGVHLCASGLPLKCFFFFFFLREEMLQHRSEATTQETLKTEDRRNQRPRNHDRSKPRTETRDQDWSRRTETTRSRKPKEHKGAEANRTMAQTCTKAKGSHSRQSHTRTHRPNTHAHTRDKRRKATPTQARESPSVSAKGRFGRFGRYQIVSRNPGGRRLHTFLLFEGGGSPAGDSSTDQGTIAQH